MKNFFSPIRALESFRPPIKNSHFLDMMYVDMKIFFSPIRANWWVLESFRPPEPKNVYSHFLDMMYVEFIKKFFSLPDSRELMGVRVISASEPKNVC